MKKRRGACGNPFNYKDLKTDTLELLDLLTQLLDPVTLEGRPDYAF